MANKIYVNENLTEKNKELFKLCLKCKRDLSYKFLWTNVGRIFLRKNWSSPVIPVNCTGHIPKIVLLIYTVIGVLVETHPLVPKAMTAIPHCLA